MTFHRFGAIWLALALFSSAGPALAGAGSRDVCPLPAPGDTVAEPSELRSINGVLKAQLGIYNFRASADAATRYCYRTPDGREAPTLRVHPGDQVILNLTNHLLPLDVDGSHTMPEHHMAQHPSGDPCSSGVMSAVSTNLHFHGMSMPATCHQDEVLKTSIQPHDAPFEYRFQVPIDAPPGLYWYHPHIHGFSSQQVTGGASGAMIVEGLERAVPEVAGLPERTFVIRDLMLLNPNAPPSTAEPVVPRPTLDPDGDIANNNTGYGKPARDLSVNFVPVPYPDYVPARILLRPKERQLWRVLNAAAITYVHVALLYDKEPQNLGVVALDGAPVDQSDASAPHVRWVNHLVIPPGSRAEFIIEGPPAGTKGLLISRMIDTGQDGENDPNRALASVEAVTSAPEPLSRLPLSHEPLPPALRPWIGGVDPVRTRKLFFSERRSNPNDPNSPTVFFITEDGKEPKVFDPANAQPDIVVHEGDVEDWVIENRSLELHAFHIHQLHFQLRNWFGIKVDEPFLRDTVNVPYFDNHMTEYPSVTVRMDFRDPNTVGTFVYHCHLLEHEDAGMMGLIRVDPRE